MFFSTEVSFLCWFSFRYPFHHCVTALTKVKDLHWHFPSCFVLAFPLWSVHVSWYYYYYFYTHRRNHDCIQTMNDSTLLLFYVTFSSLMADALLFSSGFFFLLCCVVWIYKFKKKKIPFVNWRVLFRSVTLLSFLMSCCMASTRKCLAAQRLWSIS